MILAGFYNTGNTCYINSVLQCFVNDKAFRNNIIKKCLVNTNLSEKYLILKTIIERINLKDDESRIVVKINIDQYNNLFFKSGLFRKFEQHDAHEFLLKILEEYEEDLKNICYGKLKLSIKCNSCKTVKNVIEEFNTLNLTIDKDEVLSIYDLFNNYFKKETHDDPKNLYYCENCKCNTVSEHKTTLWKLPKKIIVNLKRYSMSGHKLNTKIKYPIDSLMVRESESNKVYNYSLENIIYHFGNSTNGHYVNSSKINNEWYLIDDDNVSVNSKVILENNNSYVLIYSQK